MTDTERRTTRQRRAVEAILRRSDGFASAQELHQRLREVGEKVGLATVYRALSAMADDGALDVLRSEDGELRYRRCASDTHHHHLVCRRCGRVVEIVGPAVETWADDAAARHGFVDVAHNLEIFGTCGECRSADRVPIRRSGSALAGGVTEGMGELPDASRSLPAAPPRRAAGTARARMPAGTMEV